MHLRSCSWGADQQEMHMLMTKEKIAMTGRMYAFIELIPVTEMTLYYQRYAGPFQY